MIVMMLVSHLRRRRRMRGIVEWIVHKTKTTGRKMTRIVPVLLPPALKTCG